MIAKQRGLTLVGFIMVLVLVVMGAYLAMRIVPMYSEYYSVRSSFDKLANEEGLARSPTGEVRSRIGRLFNVSYVDSVESKDVQIDRSRSGVVMSIEYEKRAPIVGNMSVVAEFKYEVTLQP